MRPRLAPAPGAPAGVGPEIIAKAWAALKADGPVFAVIGDAALLRAGRFDRHVAIDRPDVKAREAILRVHARHVKLCLIGKVERRRQTDHLGFLGHPHLRGDAIEVPAGGNGGRSACGGVGLPGQTGETGGVAGVVESVCAVVKAKIAACGSSYIGVVIIL